MRPGGYNRPPGMPGFFEGAPVTKALLIINLAILVIEILLTPPTQPLAFRKWFSFTVEDGIFGGQIWRLLSFQFLHGDFGHLISNSIGLFFFGPHIERWMSSRPFLIFYLLCGVAGALFYTLLYFIPGIFDNVHPASTMVGASAGLFGILAAFYHVAPNARVLLFFVIPMQMKTLAIGYFCLEIIAVLFNWHNAGGSAGHLGGALLGLLILKNAKAKELLIRLSRIGDGSRPTPKKKSSRDAQIIREKNRSPIELSKEVDRILDKISAEGIQSLSPKERKTLDEARNDK